MSPAFPTQPLDWKVGAKYFHTIKYANTCDNITHPFVGKEYSSTEEIECDLQHISTDIVKRAELFIPRKKSKQQKRSGTNSFLYIYAGKVDALSEAGRMQGDHDRVQLPMREKCKKDVCSYVKKCRAHLVRKQIQKRDEMIQQNLERFKSNHHTKTVYTKLLSNGNIISNPNNLLNCWADLFHSLGQSQGNSNEHLHLSQQREFQLQTASRNGIS